MKTLQDRINEQQSVVEKKKYNTDAEVFGDYMRGEINLKELQDNVITKIATKKELLFVLNNKFMLSVQSDSYGIPVKDIIKKIEELLTIM